MSRVADKPLTFVSLFAGIEGFGAGLEAAGMRCAFQVEIDPQCRSVLARHWPDVPRWNDVREFDGAATTIRPDWLCGGFPCQDLSVAGRRAGLAGERSGLWHEFHRVVAEFRPSGVLIENVPGLLSSNGGRDMGIVLGGLGQLGYWWAYRVLDAQWFGVAQRRRRVFIVGCLGDRRRAAEILFERESLPWDSPPSRTARERTAASLASGVSTGSGVNRPGRRREDDFNIVNCLDRQSGGADDNSAQANHLVAFSNRGIDSSCFETLRSDSNGALPMVAHALRSEGADASEDGTGRGTPVVPVYCLQHAQIGRKDDAGPQGKGWQENLGFTLDNRSASDAVAFCFDE
ncbi:MAG TPA: DNA cytosine methyltransferase, partial [Pirellulaceae bacterium]|nr:DNA cytosine methyltransferase [Pirellulaceae bacterium]